MNERLKEIVEEARDVIAKMKPELVPLDPTDQFNICTEIGSIQTSLSKIKEIAGGS
jgi:hypothetical protein